MMITLHSSTETSSIVTVAVIIYIFAKIIV